VSAENGAYERSGVSIDAGAKAVDLIREKVGSTFNSQVVSGIGHFGGLYDLRDTSDSVLVSSVDGVGTKLKVAVLADRHDTVGSDLVNHCVNDILTIGARPLFFLDYIAAGKVRPERVAALVGGMADACRATSCSLIGGETAEMPDIYKDEDYDLAGFIVGIVARQRLVDGTRIRAGDAVISLPSNGLHTNGYSLVRDVFGLRGDREGAIKSLQQVYPELGAPLADELLRVHRCYLDDVNELVNRIDIHGMAHITGGGLVENIPRILPEGLGVRIDGSAWIVPPVFRLIQKLGRVSDEEMYRVFNMGIGYILVCSPVDATMAMITSNEIRVIGAVVESSDRERVKFV
jgi:phosphoribosylformylglycinamidine cyclo-ligase